MKVIQKHDVKDKQFIMTRIVSDFTGYELEVLKKLYDNNGLSISEDEFDSKYNNVVFNLVRVGLIYDDYDSPQGTYYQLDKECIKQLLDNSLQLV